MKKSTVATVHSEIAEPSDGLPSCQLVVIEGPDMGRAVRIEEGLRIVGTGEDCDLKLTDDRVSARHLSIQHTDSGFQICDLGSRNGTISQGSAITEATLKAGSTLKIGHSFLRIQPLPQAIEVAPSQSRRFGDLVAESLSMREVFAVLELASASDVTVLIEGETGVGKELVARAIHETSDRRKKGPFVAVDCSALPESLVDSELFGHVRGAFTGATHSRKGAFLRADKGTLFLDELGSIPGHIESKLLRAIEQRTIKAVGSDTEKSIDVRLVAASRHDLLAKVAEGSFRPDLYYRLSVIRVQIPPLRDRREDIAPIISELLLQRGIESGPVHGPQLQRLYAHSWPGNVRELRNVVDRSIALCPTARSFAELRMSADSLSGGSENYSSSLSVRSDLKFSEAKKLLLSEFERRYLTDMIARCEGNISAAARESGLDRKHFRELARRHGLIEPKKS